MASTCWNLGRIEAAVGYSDAAQLVMRSGQPVVDDQGAARQGRARRAAGLGSGERADPAGYEWRGHKPGQYVRLGVIIDGRYHWRAYSLTSDPEPEDGLISVTPK
jgi:hypothetical protein